ncbi:MAG: family 2 glycosyl transferase [Bacteroidetes bacterium B1(2017)]|nr:MAG: family 2 glycosyl transferase [Bacteroidetes bacterium B1(2017)]
MQNSLQKVSKPSPKEALFSILIPTWNNLPYLQLCIQSILKNSIYTHQILIHVNEGSDGTIEWIKESGYGYSISNENIGVCYALNSLASMATTNYILYLNDDMYVAPNWDLHLFEAIEAKGDPYFYYSGTMVEYEDTGNRAVLAPYNFGTTFNEFKESEFKIFAASIKHSDWFGSCWPPSIVHKTLWDKVGGYDIAYTPGFYSDPDFAMKLWNVGVRDFRGIGASLVYHFKCKSTGRVVRNNGRKTFAQKWGISSSFLYKKILKMGMPAEAGMLLSYPSGPSLWMAKIKAWYIANF